MSYEEAINEWREVKKKEQGEHTKFLKTIQDIPYTCVFCATEFNLSGKRSKYWVLVYEGTCPHCDSAIETIRSNVEISKK